MPDPDEETGAGIEAAGWVANPSSDEEWEELVLLFAAGHPRPLRQVIESVRLNGCTSVVVENRYVDADYRSEFALFWAQRFAETRAFAVRLHFFREPVSPDDLHRLTPDHGYLGYSVLRPSTIGPVGRTVVAPPPAVEEAVTTIIEDRVSVFGATLTVKGAPFCQQDGEFLRCAHVAAWVCHYAAFRRGLVARRLAGAFVQMAPQGFSLERSLPSKGMKANELQAVFGELGQPALFYGLSNMPRVPGVDDPVPDTDPGDPSGSPRAPGYWDTRIFSVICRYLNSGFPVLVATANHAFVLVGWFRDGDGPIRLVACDDQRGPYEIIDSPFTDDRAPWQALMIPLPPKVYLSGEMAETVAHRRFREWGGTEGAPAAWASLEAGLRDKSTVSLRTVLIDSRKYKAALSDQGRPEGMVRVLRLARLPQWVWVVEAHDRALRKAGEPSVLAEVVFDTTSSDLSPREDAIVLPGAVKTNPPEGGEADVEVFPESAWSSLLSSVL